MLKAFFFIMGQTTRNANKGAWGWGDILIYFIYHRTKVRTGINLSKSSLLVGWFVRADFFIGTISAIKMNVDRSTKHLSHVCLYSGWLGLQHEQFGLFTIRRGSVGPDGLFFL